MGFGFNLGFVFNLAPLAPIAVVAWLRIGTTLPTKVIAAISIGILAMALMAVISRWLWSKTILEKTDYHGAYIIHRGYFPGKQANWQYDHFRFEIKNNDSIYFYETDEGKILKSHFGTIFTTNNYRSARLIITMVQPSHHILTSNPSIYRTAWGFYLVFNSPKFKNVYFEKGQWSALD